MYARKLRSTDDNYTKIIEVTAPIRFYWNKEGFDGINVGPFTREEPITEYQIKLIHQCLNAILLWGIKK